MAKLGLQAGESLRQRSQLLEELNYNLLFPGQGLCDPRDGDGRTRGGGAVAGGQRTSRPHVGLQEDISPGAQTSENGSTAEERDRRSAPRRSPEEVSWIVDAKVTAGQAGDSAEIVDLSSGGALVQTGARLVPGSAVALVLSGAKKQIRRGRVIRSTVTSITSNGELYYRTAIQFDQTISVDLDGVDAHRSAVTTPQEDVQPKATERRADLRAYGPLQGGWHGASGKRASRITDISERGCYVESMATPPPGERILLKLMLPEGGELHVTGEVLTVDLNIGFAMRFVELTARQKVALRQTVQHFLWREVVVPRLTTGATTEPNSPDAVREDDIAMVPVWNDW